MSFSLFPLWAVAGLAALAAAIPIVIHLLHRQRTQPVLWGAMMFLKESPLQQKRRKKVDHWLLMLLRIAVVVLLVLLIAWPQKNKQWSVLGGGGGTDIAVVIDHSLSTGRTSNNATVFQQSVAELEKLAKSGSLKSTDTISVILAEHQPRKVTALPVSTGASLDRVIADLKKMKPGASDASIPDAIQAAREVIGRGRNGKKMVVVLGDNQRVGWKPNDLTAWNAAVGQRVRGVEPDMKVYEMAIRPEAGAANVTVADLVITPSLLGPARPADVSATLINTGQKEIPNCNAKLMVTGKQVAQMAIPAIAAGQSRTIRFEHTITDPNSNWVEVQVDATDGLSEDNRAVASAFVWQNLPILVIDGQLTNIGPDATASAQTFRTFKNSRYLLNAMLSDAANPDAPPLVKPTVISIADPRINVADPKKGIGIKLEDFAAVVLNDVPQIPTGLQNVLGDYARSGHGVWVILGKNAERSLVKDAIANSGLANLELKEEQAAVDVAPALDAKDPNNPMLQLLSSPEHNVMAGMNTFKWWAVKPLDADAKVVLAAAGSGAPLIIERNLGSNGGRVVIWTSSVDRSWNTWPSVPAFAPLVNNTLYHCAAGQTKGVENRRLDSGQPIVWTGPATPAISKVTVTRPDGTKAERRPVVRDNRQIITYNDTYLPGKYEMAFDQTAIPQPVYYGVGIDRNELDENVLSDDDRKWLSSDDHKYIQDSLDPAKGLAMALGGGGDNKGSIWPILALIVLGMLLFETYMTYRMIKRQGQSGAEMIPGAGLPKPIAA